MQSIYQFDQSYIKTLIKKTERKLARTICSKERQNLQEEIALFKNFLLGNYEGLEISSPPLPKDLTKAKNQILSNMRRIYKILGEDTINWLFKLEQDRLFQGFESSSDKKINLPSQVLLTEENYKRISPTLYKQIKRLLRVESGKIQETTSLESSSYCHHVIVTDEPILIINPNESPSILNHEIEHAAEILLKYIANYYYQELGPLYMEHHFLERLYEQQGFLSEGDYGHRFQNIDDYLEDANAYLRLISLFKERNFSASTDEFIKIISDYETLSEEQVLPYIYEQCIGTDEDESLMYILSYLKSLELYDESANFQDDHIKLLRPDISQLTARFKPPQEGYKVYEKYITKMQTMTK